MISSIKMGEKFFPPSFAVELAPGLAELRALSHGALAVALDQPAGQDQLASAFRGERNVARVFAKLPCRHTGILESSQDALQPLEPIEISFQGLSKDRKEDVHEIAQAFAVDPQAVHIGIR
jgi:hypothetical protein